MDAPSGHLMLWRRRMVCGACSHGRSKPEKVFSLDLEGGALCEVGRVGMLLASGRAGMPC